METMSMSSRFAARLHEPLLLRTQSFFSRPSPSSSSSSSSSSLFSLCTGKHRTLHYAGKKSITSMAKRDPSFKDDQLASSADLHFEPPLRIVEYPDPRLRANNKRVGIFDDGLKKLVDGMFDIMYKTDGIGLSAPQVGINVQLMVFNAAGEPGEGDEIVLVNPRVSKYSQKITNFEEGCLSFPGINGDVKRPESVKVDAKDLTGARFSVTLSGLPARVFQHEFDHLQGILFFERMTDEVLDTIRADLQALETKYEGITGLPSPETINTNTPSPEKIKTRKIRTAAVGFGSK